MKENLQTLTGKAAQDFIVGLKSLRDSYKNTPNFRKYDFIYLVLHTRLQESGNISVETVNGTIDNAFAKNESKEKKVEIRSAIDALLKQHMPLDTSPKPAGAEKKERDRWKKYSHQELKGVAARAFIFSIGGPGGYTDYYDQVVEELEQHFDSQKMISGQDVKNIVSKAMADLHAEYPASQAKRIETIIQLNVLDAFKEAVEYQKSRAPEAPSVSIPAGSKISGQAAGYFIGIMSSERVQFKPFLDVYADIEASLRQTLKDNKVIKLSDVDNALKETGELFYNSYDAYFTAREEAKIHNAVRGFFAEALEQQKQEKTAEGKHTAAVFFPLNPLSTIELARSPIDRIKVEDNGKKFVLIPAADSSQHKIKLKLEEAIPCDKNILCSKQGANVVLFFKDAPSNANELISVLNGANLITPDDERAIQAGFNNYLKSPQGRSK